MQGTSRPGLLWDRIQHVGQAAAIEFTKPETTTSQRHRENAGQPDQTASDYYQVNVFYPLIEHARSSGAP